MLPVILNLVSLVVGAVVNAPRSAPAAISGATAIVAGSQLLPAIQNTAPFTTVDWVYLICGAVGTATTLIQSELTRRASGGDKDVERT